MRGVLSNLDKVDFRDPGKTKTQFSPYLDPIKSAIDAASKTAAARPGDVSFGAWVQGGAPPSQVFDFQGLRVTPNVYTTLEEIDTFAEAMEQVIKLGSIPG